MMSVHNWESLGLWFHKGQDILHLRPLKVCGFYDVVTFVNHLQLSGEWQGLYLNTYNQTTCITNDVIRLCASQNINLLNSTTNIIRRTCALLRRKRLFTLDSFLILHFNCDVNFETWICNIFVNTWLQTKWDVPTTSLQTLFFCISTPILKLENTIFVNHKIANWRILKWPLWSNTLFC